jgi:hypothetical protein
MGNFTIVIAAVAPPLGCIAAFGHKILPLFLPKTAEALEILFNGHLPYFIG